MTISLVPEARGGPFVFWDDLAEGCRKAAGLGFDGVEVFPPDATAIATPLVRRLLSDHGLNLAAVGTGAGWVKHKLTLTDADSPVRRRAADFVRSIIDAAGSLGAPAIIGSMQGRWSRDVPIDAALAYLCDALEELGEYARQFSVPLLYEPLNRYETNIVNSVSGGDGLLLVVSSDNVRLLADLFHMNIEDADMPAAIRRAGKRIGHLHFVDSNREPAGRGHTDFGPIVAALREIGYNGYASAEALPIPKPDLAAWFAIEGFRQHFRM